MPNILDDIINDLLPWYLYDRVAVFDQDFNQLFRNARAIKAVVKEQAKVMEHPVENGTIIVDHRIILPVEIELSMILTSNDYTNTYNQIRQFYLNSTLLLVQTRSGVYQNQIIQGMPHEENPDQYDVLTLALSLKQVQFVTAMYGTAPQNPTNMNNTDRGMQLPKPATPDQSSIIGGWWDKIKRFFGG